MRWTTQIGKTSSLVMTLCGVLKDILLVVASMLIFLDPVSPLQFAGYSLALCGLVYYKLGAEKMLEYGAGVYRAWAEFGLHHPVRRVVYLVIAAVGVILVLVVLSDINAVAANYELAQERIQKMLEKHS